MTAAAQPGRRGVHFGWLFLGAAIIGIVVGTVLAKREQQKQEQALDEVAKRAEAMMPQGAPAMYLPPNPDLKESVDPFAPDPRALAGIPPYPGAVPRSLIGGTPKVEDAFVAVAWFETTDSPDAVVSFYEEAFAQAQLVYVAHRESEKLGYAAYINPRKDQRLTRAVVHLVTAIRQGSQTLVLVSTSTPGLMLESNAQLPPGVVLPPNAKTPQVLDLTEFGQARQTVFARVENTSVQSVVDWYTRYFQEHGLALVEKNLDNPTQFSMTAAGEAGSLVLQLRPGEGGVDLVVSYQHRAGAPPTGETP